MRNIFFRIFPIFPHYSLFHREFFYSMKFIKCHILQQNSIHLYKFCLCHLFYNAEFFTIYCIALAFTEFSEIPEIDAALSCISKSLATAELSDCLFHQKQSNSNFWLRFMIHNAFKEFCIKYFAAYCDLLAQIAGVSKVQQL